MSFSEYLNNVRTVDSSFSTNLNDVINCQKVVNIDTVIHKEVQAFHTKKNAKRAFESLKRSAGPETVCEPQAEEGVTDRRAQALLADPIRLIVPVLSQEALRVRFEALRELREPIKQSLIEHRPVYLGGVGSKFLFIQDFLRYCVTKPEASSNKGTRRKKVDPSKTEGNCAVANYVVQAAPFHARFHPRSIALLLQALWIPNGPGITTSTTPARMLQILTDGLEAHPRTTLVVVHSADIPSVSSFVADILLPLQREFPKKLHLLCTFDDLRFETLLDMWGATRDPRCVVCPYLHTLLDHREEVKVQYFEARTHAETERRSLVPIVNSAVSSVISKGLVGLYQSQQEDAMDLEVSDYESDGVEDSDEALWQKLQGVITNSAGMADLLRRAFGEKKKSFVDQGRLPLLNLSKVQSRLCLNFARDINNLKESDMELQSNPSTGEFVLKVPTTVMARLFDFVSK